MEADCGFRVRVTLGNAPPHQIQGCIQVRASLGKVAPTPQKCPSWIQGWGNIEQCNSLLHPPEKFKVGFRVRATLLTVPPPLLEKIKVGSRVRVTLGNVLPPPIQDWIQVGATLDWTVYPLPPPLKKSRLDSGSEQHWAI